MRSGPPQRLERRPSSVASGRRNSKNSGSLQSTSGKPAVPVNDVNLAGHVNEAPVRASSAGPCVRRNNGRSSTPTVAAQISSSSAKPPSAGRPSSAGSSTLSRPRRRKVDEYPVLSRPIAWSAAECNGRVRKPKLARDEVKLREICKQCRAGNFREVRAIAVHFPHILSLTDKHGFSPVHHAEMSGNPEFVAQILKLYRDPKTFALKILRFETEADMWQDEQMGLQLQCLANNLSGRRNRPYTVTVQNVPHGTQAASAGLMPGDVLEAIRNDTALLESRIPPPKADNVFGALRGPEWKFPLTLEFRGSTLAMLLGKDGWTPLHGAAGHGACSFRRSILRMLLSEEQNATHTRDVCGATALDVLELASEQTSRPSERNGRRMRPLSATPQGAMVARDFQQGVVRLDEPHSAIRRRPVSASATRPPSATTQRVTAPPSRPVSGHARTNPISAHARTNPDSDESGAAIAWAMNLDMHIGSYALDNWMKDDTQQDVAPPPCGIPDLIETTACAQELPIDAFLLESIDGDN